MVFFFFVSFFFFPLFTITLCSFFFLFFPSSILLFLLLLLLLFPLYLPLSTITIIIIFFFFYHNPSLCESLACLVDLGGKADRAFLKGEGIHTVIFCHAMSCHGVCLNQLSTFIDGTGLGWVCWVVGWCLVVGGGWWVRVGFWGGGSWW